MNFDYEKYTKRKQYTRSLSLELVPVGKTRETIQEQKLLEYDKNLYSMAEELRPAIDEFLKAVTEEALEQTSCEFNSYYKNYLKLKNPELTTEEKQTLLYEKATIKKELIEQIKKDISAAMPGSLSIQKMNSAEFLFVLLPELLQKYKIDNADIYAAKLFSLKGCTPLFNTFINSRITILETHIPERVVENLDLYCENMVAIEGVLQSDYGLPSILKDSAEKYNTIESYKESLSQRGINEYNNMITGTYSSDGTKIAKGINEYINEWNQENIADKSYNGPIYRKIKKLYKQIMTEREKLFFKEGISSDEELKELLKNTVSVVKDPILKALSLLSDKTLIERAYIDGRNLHQLSFLLTGKHETISNILEEKYLKEVEEKYIGKTSKRELSAKRKEEDNANFTIRKSSHPLSTIIDMEIVPREIMLNLITSLAQERYNTIILEEIPNKFYDEKTKIKGSTKNTDKCKKWLDTVIEFKNYIRLFISEAENSIISSELEEIVEEFKVVTEAYNRIRNYITKSMKESTKAMNCCFGVPLKMDTGTWYHGREKFDKAYNTIIRKEGKYYFLTLTPSAKPVRFSESEAKSNASILLIKKGQQAFRQIPKILFSDAKKFYESNTTENVFVMKRFVKEPLVISRKVYEIYKNKLFKTPGKNASEEELKMYRENLVAYLELCRRFCENYLDYSSFNMEGIPEASSFKNSNDFFNEIDTRLISMRWVPIKEEQLDELVDTGKALLFLITNRNMYQEGRNKTSYAKILLSILDEEHCKNPKIRLNARASVTYREPMIEGKITHKAGSIVVNGKDKEGKPIPPHIQSELYQYYNKKLTTGELSEEAYVKYVQPDKAIYHETTHDLTYNKRYASEKFIIKLSYNINNEIPGDTTKKLNEEIEKERLEGKNILVLARGTQDLLYYTLADANGNIQEHGDLNSVDGVNYMELLKSRYKEGIDERKNWDYSKNTKNLKDAYLKNIIAKVAKMALEHNAVIVVENIPPSVKNKYVFLDNQIFKGFESKLNEKLMNLSFKDRNVGEPGSYDNPIQLSFDTKSFQKGILYHVSGAYSMSRCPESGFKNRFQIGKYKTITAKRNFLSSFNSIEYNEKSHSFHFTFQYSKCGIKLEKEEEDTPWTVIGSGPRTRYNTKTGKPENIEDIAKTFLEPLKNELKNSWNEPLSSSITTMPSTTINLLFDLFCLAVSGRIFDSKTHKTGYISPITQTCHDNISYIMAQNLLHSFLKSKGNL